MFDSIPAGGLVARLQKTDGRGPKGYRAESLFRTFIASYYLNHDSISDTVRALQDNPALAEACDLDPWCIPSRPTLSRFFKKLSENTEELVDALAMVTDQLKVHLPGFGDHVTIDSSAIRAHANPDRDPISDPDSGWIAKEWASRTNHKSWIFGYRLHLVADATHELPIGMYVTGKGKGSGDSSNLLPLLEQARERFDWFSPATCAADKGYDSLTNYRGIIEDFDAIQIIAMRKIQKGAKKRRPNTEYRTEYAIPRDSKEWKRLYARRTSVERVFGRLKETRRLERHCYRGLAKVELHCLLSVLTLQAKALAQVKASEGLRDCLRKVA